ncbi:hypothetical protein [Crossiella sp. NPDC003009]
MSARRMAGKDRELTVTATLPAGITVSGPERFRLDDGQARYQVSASAPEGYYDIPVTIAGEHRTVHTTVTVLVAPEGSLVIRYGNTGIADDNDKSQANLDGGGNSHPRQALAEAGLTGGKQVEVAGTTFTWPAAPAGRPDNVAADGQTVSLTGQPRRRTTISCTCSRSAPAEPEPTVQPLFPGGAPCPDRVRAWTVDRFCSPPPWPWAPPPQAHRRPRPVPNR